MGFLNKKFKWDWKYILGEVFLIFVGINLAIWFNNWNTEKNNKEDKAVAISKIIGELENNKRELIFADSVNQRIQDAFSDFGRFFSGNTSTVITTPEDMRALAVKHPGFYRVTDSIRIDNENFKYNGGTFISLELPTISQIAWETTKSLNIGKEFSYECLYDLESTYLLQRRVNNELDKAANALQRRDLEDLRSILTFLDQLSAQLLEDYDLVLGEIEECAQ